MNESDISDDKINVPAGGKKSGIMSSSWKWPNNNFNYDGIDPSIVSEEWHQRTVHPGKTFETPPKKFLYFILKSF